MKKRIVLLLLCLTGCAGGEMGTDIETNEELTTETAKTSQIATEEVISFNEINLNTEKSTQKFELNEELTEEPSTFCAPPTEEETEETIEESTGDIDVNGYGWVELQYSAPYNIMEDHLTRSNGSIRVFGHRETWYSTNEACGVTTARDIPGKHVADDGTIRDGDGFICVASSDLSFYSIVMTSVGPGKVYDCGCSSGTIDVYTAW